MEFIANSSFRSKHASFGKAIETETSRVVFRFANNYVIVQLDVKMTCRFSKFSGDGYIRFAWGWVPTGMIVSYD